MRLYQIPNQILPGKIKLGPIPEDSQGFLGILKDYWGFLRIFWVFWSDSWRFFRISGISGRIPEDSWRFLRFLGGVEGLLRIPKDFRDILGFSGLFSRFSRTFLDFWSDSWRFLRIPGDFEGLLRIFGNFQGFFGSDSWRFLRILEIF